MPTGLPGDVERVDAVVSDALQPMIDYFTDYGWNENFNTTQPVRYEVPGLNPNTPGALRLRLDWELADNAFEELFADKQNGRRQILDLMKMQAQTDLVDLLLNGDSQASNDALLKGIDGEYKRGQFLASVSVGAAQLHVEQTRRESREFTLYMTLYPKFD